MTKGNLVLCSIHLNTSVKTDKITPKSHLKRLSMVTPSTTLWLLLAIIPLVMATFMFGHDNNNDIVQVLVQQVRDLQATVNQQGKRIEDLELRLAQHVFPEGTDDPDGNNEAQCEGHQDDGEDKAGQEYNLDGGMDSLDEPTSTKSGNLNRGIRSGATVAFSVYLTSELKDLSTRQTIKFTGVLYNDGGHYTTDTGTFTAPVTGVYMFIYFINDATQNNTAAVRLVVDGVQEVDAFARPLQGYDVMGGNSAILRVNAGQAVWLQTYGWYHIDLYSATFHRVVTFSGFLIN